MKRVATLTTYLTATDVPPAVRHIRDSEEGTWQRMDDTEYFMPEFAGGNMTLTEIIDHFGPVKEVTE